jgi:hypothetical protein
MTAPFNHPDGEAAIERLKALPSPTRDRVLVLVNRRLYPPDNEPLGFEPSDDEKALAAQFADAIASMVREAGLSQKVEGSS